MAKIQRKRRMRELLEKIPNARWKKLFEKGKWPNYRLAKKLGVKPEHISAIRNRFDAPKTAKPSEQWNRTREEAEKARVQRVTPVFSRGQLTKQVETQLSQDREHQKGTRLIENIHGQKLTEEQQRLVAWTIQARTELLQALLENAVCQQTGERKKANLADARADKLRMRIRLNTEALKKSLKMES